MTRPVPSDALLRYALLAYERLAKAVGSAGDPELGYATMFDCGRRAVGARMEAEPWLVPPSVVGDVERLIGRMSAATGDEIGTWLDAFPNRLLALLERRAGGLASAGTPRRRWVDRLGERRPIAAPDAVLTSAGR